jgi:hypothetical protein
MALPFFGCPALAFPIFATYFKFPRFAVYASWFALLGCYLGLVLINLRDDEAHLLSFQFVKVAFEAMQFKMLWLLFTVAILLSFAQILRSAPQRTES